MAGDMKVFRMNEFDWVAAKSLDEAVKWYLKEFGLTREEIEPKEVSLDETMLYPCDRLNESELEKSGEFVLFYGEPHVRMTFREVLERDKIDEPCVIASTER